MAGALRLVVDGGTATVRRRTSDRLARAALGLDLLLASGLAAAPAAAERAIPDGLVYLRTVAPGIVQDIRYATAANFTGAKVPGYEAAECILTREAAAALRRVHGALAAQGLGLAVLDCYRPKTAVRAFVRWVERADATTDATGAWHHPTLPRRDLIQLGYIAAQSGHSRADTVDLTLVRLGASSDETAPRHTRDCTQTSAEAIDMGTAFDCFDPRSHTLTTGITAEQRRWRTVLTAAMTTGGFRNYAREWWHFTFGAGKGPSYDFPIVRAEAERGR